MKTHGMSSTPSYRIWRGMKSRCYNKNNKSYKHYGGRGIKICDDWLNNAGAFCKWALNNGYKKGLSIERINVNGNYEPNNCTFIPIGEQANNKTNKVNITINSEVHSETEWSKIAKISKNCIRKRRLKGKTGEELIEPTTRGVITQKAKEVGIRPALVARRKAMGWSEDRLYEKPHNPSHLITINGITKNKKLWAKELGVFPKAISERIKKGYSEEELLVPAKYFSGRGNRKKYAKINTI